MSDIVERQEPVPVTGIWLRTIGDYVEVLAEFDGGWRLLIRDHREANISHIIEPLGMRKRPFV